MMVWSREDFAREVHRQLVEMKSLRRKIRASEDANESMEKLEESQRFLLRKLAEATGPDAGVGLCNDRRGEDKSMNLPASRCSAPGAGGAPGEGAPGEGAPGEGAPGEGAPGEGARPSSAPPEPGVAGLFLTLWQCPYCGTGHADLSLLSADESLDRLPDHRFGRHHEEGGTSWPPHLLN